MIHILVWYMAGSGQHSVINNGFIIAYGTITPGNNVTTTFPISFTTRNRITTSSFRTSIEAWSCAIYTLSLTNVKTNTYTNSQFNYSRFDYICIGY